MNNNYYMIITKKGNHYHVLDTLGSMRGISEDLLFNQTTRQDTLAYSAYLKSSSEVITMASYIFTRQGDTQDNSHETNKLWNALTNYLFVCIPYNELKELPEKGAIDLKPFLVTEEYFLRQIKNSEVMENILHMNTLGERLPRKEVVLKVVYSKENWCYVTDYLNKSSLEGKGVSDIIIPLHVNTDNVNDYITNLLGKDYKHGF